MLLLLLLHPQAAQPDDAAPPVARRSMDKFVKRMSPRQAAAKKAQTERALRDEQEARARRRLLEAANGAGSVRGRRRPATSARPSRSALQLAQQSAHGDRPADGCWRDRDDQGHPTSPLHQVVHPSRARPRPVHGRDREFHAADGGDGAEAAPPRLALKRTRPAARTPGPQGARGAGATRAGARHF